MTAPSLGCHPVGAKKVQQKLAQPNFLEWFFPEKNRKKVSKLWSDFDSLWSLSKDFMDKDLEAVRNVLPSQHKQHIKVSKDTVELVSNVYPRPSRRQTCGYITLI